MDAKLPLQAALDTLLAENSPAAHASLARLAVRHARRGDSARARFFLEPLRARGLLEALSPILDAEENRKPEDAAELEGLARLLAPGALDGLDPARGEADWHRFQMVLAPLSLAGLLYAPERLDAADAEELRALAEDCLASAPRDWSPWTAIAALDLFEDRAPQALIASRCAAALAADLIRPPALPRLIYARALLRAGETAPAAEEARACFVVVTRTKSGGAPLAVSGDAALLAARSLTEAGAADEALSALELVFPARDSGRARERARALIALGRREEARALAQDALKRLESSRIDAPKSELQALRKIAGG